MSILDHEIMRRLSFNQAELARILRITRQAVSIGIKKEESYLSSNNLLRIYDTFIIYGDRRAQIVEEILKKQFGVTPNYQTPSSISSSPEGWPEAEEVWLFAENPLELTIPAHAFLMRKQFASAEKTIVYFVGTPNIGHQLAQRLSYEVGAVNREGKQSAKIYIVHCTSMVMIMSCIFFNPRTQVKGYFKNRVGTFTMMPEQESRSICSAILTAGVRVEESNFFPQGTSSSVLWNGLFFEVIHQFK